jgi:hypothetical protein
LYINETKRSNLLRLADHARALAQSDVLCRVHEQRLIEGGFADFMIARASYYLLPPGSKRTTLKDSSPVLDLSVMRTEQEQVVKLAPSASLCSDSVDWNGRPIYPEPAHEGVPPRR